MGLDFCFVESRRVFETEEAFERTLGDNRFGLETRPIDCPSLPPTLERSDKGALPRGRPEMEWEGETKGSQER